MIGRMLGNRYEIVEQIGIGGMAVVYKAKCHLLDRFVAIKVLKEEFTEDEDFIRKFRRESQAAASLSHPNILNIYDVGSEDTPPKKIHYIVMEYIKGKTLKEVIIKEGKLDHETAINYSIQIVEALLNAHNNHIIHRDIKPHNIMITEDGRVKVTDFGIARAVTSSTITTTSNVLGSVHYFSPEQARGGYTDEKSDIYSAGIVMYEMLTGSVPFDGETPIGVALKHVQDEMVPPIEADANIPVELNNIIMKCVQKRQSDRYQSASELLADLKNYRANNLIITEKVNGLENTSEMTKVIPVVSVNGKPKGDIEETENMAKKTKKKKDEKKPLIIIAAILAAFALTSLIFFGYRQLKDNIRPSGDIQMPSLVGMTLEAAEGLAKENDFQINVIERVNNDEYDAGEIISQNVDEGVRIRPGYPVGVIVSMGQDSETVPLLVNRSLLEAEELIKEANLRMSVTYEFHDSIPIDVVISQDVEPMTSVDPNTRVTVVVSKGEETREIVMIQLVGMTISQAMNEIVGMDLVVGETKYEENPAPPNQVTWQSYDPGTTLETGTAVDLYISSGPAPDPVEPTEPVDPEEPVDPIGQVESDFSFVLTPFSDREQTNVTIIRKQNNKTETVYNSKHKAEDGPFEVTVRGITGAEFEIYFDDIYQFTRVKED